MFLQTIKNVFFTILVLIYFIFEEIIWNKLALPFINYIKQFNLYKMSLNFISEQDKYIILILFCSMFGFAEYLGILAFVFLGQAHVLMFCLFYVLKTLFAVYSLAILNNSKEKLFSFKWFKFTYDLLMKIIDYIKNSKYYISIKESLKIFKLKLKYFLINYKENIKNLIIKLKTVYCLIKNFAKKIINK